MKLDLYQGTSSTYAGYDRFGQTIRQEWDKYNTGAGVLDRFDYTYDYAGNRLSRNIPSSLYSTDDRDQVYGYDGLLRLKSFDEGTQSGSSISGTGESKGTQLIVFAAVIGLRAGLGLRKDNGS